MLRLPAGRTAYKELIASQTKDLESSSNAVKFRERGFFLKRVPLDLFDNKCFAYIVLDPVRKGKEVSELLSSEYSTEEIALLLQRCGIMILVSSLDFSPESSISSYYSRQEVEQVFGFFKDDLDSLPIRCHHEDTIKGYLFLQFLALIVFTQLRVKLPNKFSVEQALLILRTRKANLLDSQIVIVKKSKKVRIIFEALDILVPNFLGILELGDNPWFVATNLDDSPGFVYDNIYCARGEMENRIREQQLGLFADRIRCHKWWANQFRLLLSSLAYILIEGIRRITLKKHGARNDSGINHSLKASQDRSRCYTQHSAHPVFASVGVSVFWRVVKRLNTA